MPPPLPFPFHLLLALSDLCSAPPSDPCPPFPSSAPPYPFSTSLGCGHPSFQIHCASPHSLLSINDLPFSLLRYDPNSSSLTLSPRPMPPPSSLDNYSSPPSSPSFAIPSSAISLSGSPFRVSDSSCSLLFVLRLCLEPEPDGSKPEWDGSCSGSNLAMNRNRRFLNHGHAYLPRSLPFSLFPLMVCFSTSALLPLEKSHMDSELCLHLRLHLHLCLRLRFSSAHSLFLPTQALCLRLGRPSPLSLRSLSPLVLSFL